ncbi:MAG: fibronectin type III domain-containing protein, partial [Chlamydiia bacterium]|nr:fibronectin type III domain-containing protein [Chlamydiia bacterium]
LSAVVSAYPVSITLNWTENTANGGAYLIKKKLKGEDIWSFLATVDLGTTSYTDNTVSTGVSYEYSVQKVFSSTNNYAYSWGYINAGINVELDYNKGDLLLLVENNIAASLPTEVAQLEEDLYKDGWMVTTLSLDKNLSAIEVKSQIQNQYNSLPNLKTIYILGHVAVPYSGNINPDGHGDHKGAWPADIYYADLDGEWTDISVNNVSAPDPRNVNIPSDGKLDQSFVPSKLELQVSRVDFFNMKLFNRSDAVLISKYLDKAHRFKTASYIPQDRGMYDDGFANMNEGFAQNAIRNFAPFFGTGNIDELDYFTTLTKESYLWSYGCGPGHNYYINKLNDNGLLTSQDLVD